MCLNAGAMGRQDAESETLIPINRCYEGEAIAFGAQNSSHQGDGVSVNFSPTLDKSKTPGVLQSSAVRRLTPIECERLQGFPDDYTLVPHRNKPAADGPRYKALGNSMAVPVMRWIGERIQMVENLPC
jgi:DNA (cytosine-5)-methyltransferase 1